jgi:uncharacterized protein with PQ loop repeat
VSDVLGWGSSGVLILTLAIQLKKQWREKTSKGVSKWLFAGQVLAETGFVAYSILLKNWVFAATNILLLIENFIGLAITLHFKRQKPS